MLPFTSSPGWPVWSIDHSTVQRIGVAFRYTVYAWQHEQHNFCVGVCMHMYFQLHPQAYLKALCNA
eukprot:scaffold649907_cov37-Prasinocladus_malaysianus.AAC.1